VKLWSAGLIIWPASGPQLDPHVDHAPIALALANFAVGLDASGHGGLTDRRGAVLVAPTDRTSTTLTGSEEGGVQRERFAMCVHTKDFFA
jgi:hypothetical protein